MMRGAARAAISIYINTLHFLDWPVTRTHVMCQAEEAGRESAVAFIPENSTRGQSVAAQRWMT